MTMITPSYLGETIEYSSLHACRSTLEDPSGETRAIAWLRTNLGIDDRSWFLRELVLAQIAAATKETDPSFSGRIPQLLALLASNLVLRDRGMMLLLDRYARIASAPLQHGLRDAAVAWWGNPWLTSNSMRWGGVNAAARAMVAEWLKLEFIESFFTLLADEGTGDRRRLEFWKRYVNAIDDIHFALGTDARSSRTRDFVELRAKMKGRTVSLIDFVSSNNAFVMTIGDLVVVEFSGHANALYGYDRRQGLPFDLSIPVVTAKGRPNSLKNTRRQVWLKHADRIHGWSTWEQMFEATLQKQFQIEPAARSILSQPPRAPVRSPTPADVAASPIPYSLTALARFAAEEGLEIDDNSSRGGNLWVRTTVWTPAADRVLSPWGFKYRFRKGWWK